MNVRALLVLEILVALITVGAGVLSWTILLLTPVVFPPLVLAPLALIKPALLARPWVKWPLHACSVLCVILSTSFIVGVAGNQRAPEEHHLPAEYTGWVVIAYEQPNGAVAARQRGGPLYRIPASGLLATQDSPNRGWARGSNTPKYMYPSGADAEIQRPIRGTFASGDCKFTFDRYWVGSGPVSDRSEPALSAFCGSNP